MATNAEMERRIRQQEAANKIFRSDSWLITWYDSRHHQIRVEKLNKAFIDYAIRYPHNGKIAYDWPESVPTYIKAKVKAAFDKDGKWRERR